MYNELKEKYINLLNNIELHYYKEKLEGHIGPHALYVFNELQTLILENGQHQKIEKIYESVCKKYKVPRHFFLVKALFSYSVLSLERLNVISVVSREEKEVYRISGELGKAYPFWISCEVTSRCCFKCKHCYKQANDGGIDMGEKDFQEIIKLFAGKTPHLVITGGEALVHPQINEFMKDGSRFFKTHLLTNAYYLEKVPQTILSHLESVQISIYGYDNDSYNCFTGVKNGADKISSNIKNLIKMNGQKCTFTIVATEHNYSNLDKMLEYCENIGIDEIVLGREFPLGRAEGKNENIREQINLAVKQIVASNRTKVAIQATESVVEEVYGEVRFHCQAGKTSIVISEKGEVRPCVLINVSSDETISQYYESCVLAGEEMKYSTQLIEANDKMNESGHGLRDIGCSGFCKIKTI